MKLAVKRRWIKALRSGKYRQGKGQLKDEYPSGKASYCCLGVLCDLYNKTCKTDRWEKTFYSEDTDLPWTVMKWAGLDDSDPVIDIKSNQEASMLNDHGSSFNEIADLIKKNL